MNADQIFRLALFQADEVKQSGTASSFITTTELMSWVNEGNRKVENALRSVRSDYFTRIMNSATDTTAERIYGISYTPSTSLAIGSSTNRITLPPDFQYMVSIRTVTSGFENMLWLPRDTTAQTFQEQLRRATTDTVTPGGTQLYDIIGERTMHIVPQLSSALDIEIIYVRRTRQLVRYTTGTIAVTDGTTAVTGVGTTWTAVTPIDGNYMDIMLGTSGSATLPVPDPSWSYDQINLANVASIETNTGLTLAANKNGTLAAGTGYILSSLPMIPPEFHYAIADYVTAKIIMKRGAVGAAAKAAAFTTLYQSVINDIRSTASTRTVSDVELVEEFDPGLRI